MSAIEKKPDDTIVVTVRITLKPGKDNDLIYLVTNAPARGLAATIRNAMRSGIQTENITDPEEDIDLGGLGYDL